MKVLKLDQGFSPVSVVDWKEAIKLVVLNKAEVIHEYENKYIRTTNCKYGMPSVIKLNNQFKRAKGYIRFNKHNDGWNRADTYEICRELINANKPDAIEITEEQFISDYWEWKKEQYNKQHNIK